MYTHKIYKEQGIYEFKNSGEFAIFQKGFPKERNVFIANKYSLPMSSIHYYRSLKLFLILPMSSKVFLLWWNMVS